MLGHLKRAVSHDVVLHHILDLLHRGGAVHLLALQLHGLGDPLDLYRRHAVRLRHGLVGLGDGDNDLGNIETDFSAVSLDDPHGASSFAVYLSPRIRGLSKYIVPIIHYILWLCKCLYRNIERTPAKKRRIFLWILPKLFSRTHKIWSRYRGCLPLNIGGSGGKAAVSGSMAGLSPAGAKSVVARRGLVWYTN